MQQVPTSVCTTAEVPGAREALHGPQAPEGAGRAATEAISAFTSSLRFEDIPAAVTERAQLDLLDCIGCALFGQSLPLATVLERAVLADAAQHGVLVWGTARSTDPATAALVNGTMVHSFELDDLHHEAVVHPGGVTAPAVMALAERNDLSGRALLAAHVAGIEVSSRIGLAAGASMLRRGWHNFGALGIFGAAAGAASALGLSPDETRHTLGVAGSFSSGLMAAQYGALVKRMHGGHAAQNGVRAAQLASQGLTGIAHIFEDGYGNFLPTFADSWEVSDLTAGLGERWETMRVGHKRFASCGSTHSTVDVVLDLRERHRLRAEDIDRVDIVCSSSNLSHVGWPYEPDSMTTAQMNLTYGVAVALLDGECFIDQFAEGRLADPRVLDLIARQRVAADPEIDRRGRAHRHEVRVTIRLTDGREVSGEAMRARGSAGDLLSADELIAKFLRLAGVVMPPAQVEAVADEVMGLGAPGAKTSELTTLLSTEKGRDR